MGKHSAESVATQADKKIMRNSHGGYGGKTIINRIERQLDKRRAEVDKLAGENPSYHGRDFVLNKGRAEGLAAALALLRSSSLTVEFERSDERMDGHRESGE